jgi:hypothetical protein
MNMTTPGVGLSAHPDDEGLRLNRDLVNQLNEMIEGEHSTSECWSSGKPLLFEGILWSLLGAVLWVVALYFLS